MANTITVDVKTIERILRDVDKLKEDVQKLAGKVITKKPAYGSNEWWELSDKEALEDIKKGDYFELTSKDDVKNFFDNINDEEYVHNTFRHKSKKTKS